MKSLLLLLCGVQPIVIVDRARSLRSSMYEISGFRRGIAEVSFCLGYSREIIPEEGKHRPYTFPFCVATRGWHIGSACIYPAFMT